MKKCFRRFEKLAGFKEHVRRRPSGVSRYDWGRKWLLAHGVAATDIPNPQKTSWVGHYTAPKDVKVETPHPATLNAFLQTFEWRQLRMRVLKRFGARCQCCGATPNDGVRMHVDHIKPRRLYPELALEESNLQVLCEVCNHGKGNWDETDWRRPQPVPVELPPDWNDPTWTRKPN